MFHTHKLHSHHQEYIRERVVAHPLVAAEPLSVALTDQELIPTHPAPITETTPFSTGVESETYIYIDIDNLVSELWSFEDFVRLNAYKWYNGDPSDSRYS